MRNIFKPLDITSDVYIKIFFKESRILVFKSNENAHVLRFRRIHYVTRKEDEKDVENDALFNETLASTRYFTQRMGKCKNT